MEITLGDDDICSSCKYIGMDGVCIDEIYHLDGVSLKDEWNKILDKRIIGYTKNLEDNKYSAHEYCEILYSIKEHIFDIWKEEIESAKNYRYDNFCSGAKKYLGIL